MKLIIKKKTIKFLKFYDKNLLPFKNKKEFK
jgi:hypothetical protein